MSTHLVDYHKLGSGLGKNIRATNFPCYLKTWILVAARLGENPILISPPNTQPEGCGYQSTPPFFEIAFFDLH
jgi:hypothetical protein